MALRHGGVEIHRKLQCNAYDGQGSGVEAEEFAREPEFAATNSVYEICGCCYEAGKGCCCYVYANPWHRFVELGFIHVPVNVAPGYAHLVGVILVVLGQMLLAATSARVYQLSRGSNVVSCLRLRNFQPHFIPHVVNYECLLNLNYNRNANYNYTRNY